MSGSFAWVRICIPDGGHFSFLDVDADPRTTGLALSALPVKYGCQDYCYVMLAFGTSTWVEIRDLLPWKYHWKESWIQPLTECVVRWQVAHLTASETHLTFAAESNVRINNLTYMMFKAVSRIPRGCSLCEDVSSACHWDVHLIRVPILCTLMRPFNDKCFWEHRAMKACTKQTGAGLMLISLTNLSFPSLSLVRAFFSANLWNSMSTCYDLFYFYPFDMCESLLLWDRNCLIFHEYLKVILHGEGVEPWQRDQLCDLWVQNVVVTDKWLVPHFHFTIYPTHASVPWLLGEVTFIKADNFMKRMDLKQKYRLPSSSKDFIDFIFLWFWLLWFLSDGLLGHALWCLVFNHLSFRDYYY